MLAPGGQRFCISMTTPKLKVLNPHPQKTHFCWWHWWYSMISLCSFPVQWTIVRGVPDDSRTWPSCTVNGWSCGFLWLDFQPVWWKMLASLLAMRHGGHRTRWHRAFGRCHLERWDVAWRIWGVRQRAEIPPVWHGQKSNQKNQEKCEDQQVNKHVISGVYPYISQPTGS